MAARWRQENYFKYAREHFALDALDSYADHPDDPTRLVPDPAKAHAIDQVASARAGLIGAQADMADALNTAQIDLAAAKKVSRNIASHLPLGQVRPGSRLLESESKLLTHAIRMSAYNSESALAALCVELTDTATRYPGTDMTLAYSVKSHPETA